jgi:DNA-binding MarR family transcriptional regulator
MTDKRKILDPEMCMKIGRSCACYNLRRAARATTRLYDDFLKPSGLRTTQYSVLMAAKLRGPVTLTKLAEMTITERTTLTRNLTVLEKKGLVLIEPGKDRRERRVSITEQGEEALVAAIPMWEAAQAHIEQGMGGERVSGLLGDLSAIISISRQRTAAPKTASP